MDAIVADIQNNIGKHYHTRLSLFPHIATRNFGFGLLVNYRIGMDVIDNAGTTSLDLNELLDAALVFGLGIPLLEGRLKIGITGKAMVRTQKKDIIPVASVLADSSVLNVDREGFGFGMDLGMMFTFPIALLPTIAATWTDFGKTTFSQSKGFLVSNVTQSPDALNDRVNVGIALHPKIGAGNKFVMSYEARDVLSGGNFLLKSHFGMEFQFGKTFDLRLGANQGYATAGIAIKSKFSTLQIVTYAEELGTNAFEKEDRRWIMKYSLGLN
jgi:hypothetical protein